MTNCGLKLFHYAKDETQIHYLTDEEELERKMGRDAFISLHPYTPLVNTILDNLHHDGTHHFQLEDIIGRMEIPVGQRTYALKVIIQDILGELGYSKNKVRVPQMEPQNLFGDGAVDKYNKELFADDDSVFQLLDVAYSLLEDGENPMKVIRMALFIAILEMHHQELGPEEMKHIFDMMADKFLKNFIKINTQVDFGEE